MGENKAFKARLTDSGVIVVNPSHASMLLREGYGVQSGGGLMLRPLEALYLAYRGRIIVELKGSALSFKDLMAFFSRRDEMLWVKFTVYHDLRNRGRRVSPGPRDNSLVYLSPNGRRIEVYVLEESRMTSLSEIAEYMDSSLRNDRLPVLAIVDRHGDVTYYSISKFQVEGG